jgi:hypothetical protein
VTQHINLYNAAFETRRELLSLQGTVAVWAAVVLVLALGALIGQLRVTALSSELQKEETARIAAQAEMGRLSAQLSERRRDTALIGEAERLQNEIAGRREVMETLRGGVIGNTDGFSEYLRAFARQSLEGLWLTGLSLAGAGQDVVLQGRSLRPELVPGYVQRLNREQVMKGHVFSELQMQRPPSPPDADAGQLPLFVEFRLATLSTNAQEEPRQ